MTFPEALDAVPPYVRDVALRLVEAAGGKEPRIDYPDGEDGWTLSWSAPAAYVDVEFDPDDSAEWFACDLATGEYGGGVLTSDDLPPLLARLLRSLA